MEPVPGPRPLREAAQAHASRLIGEGLLDVELYRSIDDTLNTLCDTLADHVDDLVRAFGYPTAATRAPLGHDGPYASALAERLTWARHHPR
ncbi:hypothetical protein [Kitasatospora sp. NPDC008115]|uniref:hypothetical protein n=1 Tax=Kitasatospora sp. NPDC008115 TaxID=3364022 RepID=UPI0036E522A3